MRACMCAWGCVYLHGVSSIPQRQHALAPLVVLAFGHLDKNNTFRFLCVCACAPPTLKRTYVHSKSWPLLLLHLHFLVLWLSKHLLFPREGAYEGKRCVVHCGAGARHRSDSHVHVTFITYLVGFLAFSLEFFCHKTKSLVCVFECLCLLLSDFCIFLYDSMNVYCYALAT